MTIELDNDTRRALGLAVQILEDSPDWLQPKSNVDYMRKLLAGKSSGRDGPIIAEAVAVALAHRTVEIVEGSNSIEAYISRIHEFVALFALAQRVDAGLLAISYVEMCERIALSREET
jgi:hypothetical protein